MFAIGAICSCAWGGHSYRLIFRQLHVVVLCALWPLIAHGGDAPEQLPIPPIVLEDAPARNLSLPEAKERALPVSPVMTLARMNVQEKYAALRAVHADYLPKIMGMFAGIHYDQPLGSVFTLRSGLSVPVNLVNQDQTLGMVSAGQPITALLKVRGLDRVTTADARIAQTSVEEARRAILSGVEQVYVGLWAAQRIRTLASAGEAASRPFAQGAPQLEAVYLESLQGLQSASSQFDQLEDQMNDLLCFPPDTILIVAELDTPCPQIASADQAVCLAVTRSPAVREAAQQVEKATAALVITRTDFLPDATILAAT